MGQMCSVVPEAEVLQKFGELGKLCSVQKSRGATFKYCAGVAVHSESQLR